MMLQRLLFSLLIAIPASLLAVSAAAVNADSERVHYPVRLNPDAKPDERKFTAEVNADKKCKSNTHDGCLLFTENTVGVIDFYLTGSKNKTSCSNEKDKSAKYVITKIELSTTPKPDDYTKGNFDVSVDPWLKANAFEKVEISNGVIYDESRETGQTSVLLFNKNSHSKDSGVKSFWYRITVTDCDKNAAKKDWTIDPRGDNEGLN